MTLKDWIKNGLRVLLLAFYLFFCFGVAAAASGLTAAAGEVSPGAAGWLLLVCCLISAAVSFPVLRSRWRGLKLTAAVFGSVFGIMTVLTQMETVVFLRELVSIIPAEIVPRLIWQGTIVAALFSPVVVLLHGKLRGREVPGPDGLPVLSGREWAQRLTLIAMLYTVIYIGFGAFIFRPLAGAAFDAYYTGLRMPWWILFFQMGRGLVWAAIAVPVLKMMDGVRWEKSLAVALLFAALMGANLLAPNPYMPDAIRLAHFVEVTGSNFLFGWLLAAILTRDGAAGPERR